VSNLQKRIHWNFQSIFHVKMEKLQYVRLTNNAYHPVRASDRSAGLDLKSAYSYLIPKNDRQLIQTDLMIMVPDGTYGRIAPRSGLALTHGITVGGEVQWCELKFSANLNYALQQG